MDNNVRNLLIEIAKKHDISLSLAKAIYEGIFTLSNEKMRNKEVNKVVLYPLGYYKIKNEKKNEVKKFNNFVLKDKVETISFNKLKKKDD